LKVFAKGEHEGVLKSQHSKDIYMIYIISMYILVWSWLINMNINCKTSHKGNE